MATLIFCIVYVGMILGNIPGLAIDRTGIALLAAIVLLVLGTFTPPELVNAVDWSTIAMLFGMMIISAQFYFSGFYSFVMQRIEQTRVHPKFFLLLVILVSGILSAVLLNDIICLAFVPLIISFCAAKNWNPKPVLLGLVAAANVGSAMTLIGNPQNILVSETIDLSFTDYFFHAAAPAFLGLFLIWGILCYQTKKHWFLNKSSKPKNNSFEYESSWQMAKGGIILFVLLMLFFFSSMPRYQLVLAAAGLLLLSRKMTSEKMLGFIDWQLLVLFFGLFLINAAFLNSTTSQQVINWSIQHGLDLSSPIQLFTTSVILTSIVSNVPAVMLLVPFVQTPFQGSLLAISSTLAGNLLLTGSIANLIVISKAKADGVNLGWKEHFKAGLPITIGTIAFSALWLYIIS